jgi:hypothetical protein
MQRLGQIVIKTNNDLDKEEADAQKSAEELRNRQPIIGLVAWVQRCWDVARDAKMPFEAKMLRALRMTNGEYEPEKLAEISEFGGSKIYMMIPDEKCTSLEAWLMDTLFVPGEKPFATEPTPEPKLTPQAVGMIRNQLAMELGQAKMNGWTVTQEDILNRLSEIHDEVKENLMDEMRKNETKAEMLIYDALVEAEWEKAIKEAIPDLCRMPAAFIKGPVYVREKELDWGPDGNPVVKTVLKRKYFRVSPFDIYPSPNNSTTDDGWLFERHRLTRDRLYKMREEPGYNRGAIEHVLREHAMGGLSDWLAISGDYERKRLEGKDMDYWDPDARIDALQWWGNVSGIYLLQNGMHPDEIEDPLAQYSVEMWLIGPYPIKVAINADPIGRTLYHKASFRDIPGSFWGKGPCYIMSDKVDACNASARSLINNLSISSGPQVGVDIGAGSPGADYTKFWPLKVWPFDMSKSQGSRPPIWFFQPQSMSRELMEVYNKFSGDIDVALGIPKFAAGANEGQTGALGTATGTSILQTNLLKGIKRVTGRIDDGWIVPSVTRQHEHMLYYDRVPELLKTDIKLVASGASSMVAREQQQVRRNEFLQLVMNPAIMQFVGPLPMIETLRAVAQGVDIDLRSTLPKKEDFIRSLMQKQQQLMLPAPGQTGRPGTGPQVNAAGARQGGADFRTV